jgi:hypothetical protein
MCPIHAIFFQKVFYPLIIFLSWGHKYAKKMCFFDSCVMVEKWMPLIALGVDIGHDLLGSMDTMNALNVREY